MNKQKGQVFPLTALMLVVLIGAAALAIDVSMAYNQQRRQQQDLDTITKLASTGYTYSQAQGFLKARGYDVSSTSGFTLTTPPLSGPYAGKSGYVEGYLTQNLRSFFGKVLSFSQFKVSVHAVAQKGGYSHRKYTIMALSNTGYSNSGNAVNCGGGATVVITGDVASNAGICPPGTGFTVNGNQYPNSAVSDPYSDITLPASTTVTASSGGTPAGLLQISNWVLAHPLCAGKLASAWGVTSIISTTVSYYYPPPGGTSMGIVHSLPNTGNYYFLPNGTGTGSSETCAPAAYYFTGNGSTPPNIDIKTTTATIASYDVSFVLDPSASSALIESSGTTIWKLFAPDSGPLRDLAIWEKQPCGGSTASTHLNGSSQSLIQGVIDLSCSDVTFNGGSSTSTGPFLVGMLICDWVYFTGGGNVAIANDPNLSSPVWGGVLVQ